MNMEEHIDKKFREGLSHHRKDPPPGIWEGIAGSVQFASGTPKPQRKRKPFGYITFAGVLLLPATVWLLWFLIHHNPDTSPQNAPKHDIRVTNLAPASHPSTENYQTETHTSTINKQPATPQTPVAEKQTKEPITTIANTIISNRLPEHTIPITKQTAPAKTVETQVQVSTPPGKVKQEIVSKDQEKKDPETSQTSEPRIADKQPEIKVEKPEISLKETVKEGLSDTLKQLDTAFQRPVTVNKNSGSRIKLWSPPKPVHLFAALLAGPVLYQDHTPYTERIRSAGEGTLLGKIQHNRVYFSTGAGISSFTDRNPSRISLERIDTVGLYHYVTSVQFQPVYDSTYTTIIGYTPVNITTKTHAAVDTVQLYEDKTLKTRYTYLQVPFIAGYEMIRKPTFSLALQGGMVYLRMLDEDRKTPVYPEGTRLIAIENLAWQRKEQLWYYQAGVQATWHPGELWFAGLSLNAARPVQSIYKNTENPVKPMSFHLGGSIGIQLR